MFAFFSMCLNALSYRAEGVKIDKGKGSTLALTPMVACMHQALTAHCEATGVGNMHRFVGAAEQQTGGYHFRHGVIGRISHISQPIIPDKDT